MLFFAFVSNIKQTAHFPSLNLHLPAIPNFKHTHNAQHPHTYTKHVITNFVFICTPNAHTAHIYTLRSIPCDQPHTNTTVYSLETYSTCNHTQRAPGFFYNLHLCLYFAIKYTDRVLTPYTTDICSFFCTRINSHCF